MKRLLGVVMLLCTLFAVDGYGQLVAEKITKDNAAQRLFSGSDAIGGIGDYYLSNGIVEAIIDNAMLSADVRLPIQNGVSPTGGTLVDLALVGKNNDQFNQMFQIANLSPSNAFFYTSVRAEVTADRATVTSAGFVLLGNISTISKPTLTAETVYSLVAGDRFITVTTTVRNRNNDPVTLFNITDATLWTIHGLLPFAPAPGRGFNNPTLSLTTDGIARALGVYPFVIAAGNLSPEDGIIDTVNGTVCGEVSYGLAPISIALDPDGPDGAAPPNVTPLNMMVGVNSTLVSGVGNPFDPKNLTMIPATGSLIYTRRVLVADRNDVAAVSNTLYRNLLSDSAVGTLTGKIDSEDGSPVEASLIIEGKLPTLFSDTVLPITQVKTDKNGNFSVVLPAGDYLMSMISPERLDLHNVKVSVAAGATTAAQLPKMSAVGRVSFTVSEKGAPVPAKITFTGLDGTPNPNFSRFGDALFFDPMTGKMVGDAQPSSFKGSPIMNFIFNTDGQGKQIVKPGKYQVIASRGNEYTVSIKEITVTAGQETSIDFAIERVIDTSGFVSADFHVHSAKSSDASAPLEDRVRSFVAENVEVIVSTDHDYITDFAPIIDKLKLNKYAKTIIGEEITTSLANPIFPDGFGHHIAFPLKVFPFETRHGAVNDEYVPAATFYDRVKLLNPGERVALQLNHPRAGLFGFDALTSGGVFTTVKFNPTKPVPQFLLLASQLGTGTRNIDFDLIELYNGDSIGFYQTIRNDWISLINQGFVKTATAVTDSHRLVIDAPGFPRSYVASTTDDPSQIDERAFTTAVISGRVMGTSGPFIRADINGQSYGALVASKKAKATLNITVTAPAWVPVEEVRILENGKVIKKFDVTTTPQVLPAPSDPTSNQGLERFKAAIKLKLSKKDSYYTIEAGVKLPDAVDTNGDGVLDRGDTNGDGKIDENDRGFVQPPSPPIYQAIAPGYVPLAFTNPIFIDRNGNGKFDAPGLAQNLVPTSATLIEGEPTGIDPHNHDNYPFFRMKVGSDELVKFWELLSPQARKLLVK